MSVDIDQTGPQKKALRIYNICVFYCRTGSHLAVSGYAALLHCKIRIRDKVIIHDESGVYDRFHQLYLTIVSAM